MTPRTFPVVLGLLCALTSLGYAAKPVVPDDRPHRDPGYRPYEEQSPKDQEITRKCTMPNDYDTYVVVSCLLSERPIIEEFIRKNYPRARTGWNGLDSDANADAYWDLESAVRQYYARGKYKNWVIISRFNRATLGQRDYNRAAAFKRFLSDFGAAKNEEGPRLTLLSTVKEPPEAYLKFVEASGGEYRKLKLGATCDYE